MMDRKTKRWLAEVDERRKLERDRRQEEATYFANRIRDEIERTERELANYRQLHEMARSQGESEVVDVWIDSTVAELRGLRRALRLLTGSDS